MTHPRLGFGVCLIFSGMLTGCVESQPQTTPEIPVVSEVEEVTPDDTVTLEVDESASANRREYLGISFEIPSSWRDMEAKMVDSKYVAPTDKGDIEITLTSMGGGIDANFDRWVKQMRPEPNDQPDWATVDVAGLECRQVDVRGRYSSGVGSDTGTRQQTRLIGIAVPLPLREFYIKLVGPREAVVEFDDELKAFLKSARREE